MAAEDIVDGEIRTHGQEWYQSDPEKISNTADEIAQSLERTIASPQEVMGLSAINPKVKIDRAKLRAYVLGRIDQFINPPEAEGEVDEAAERQKIWEARVELVYDQFGSVRIYIDNPKYRGARVIYIDNLAKVIEVLGNTPTKGDVIKVTNLRRKAVIKTPGPKGTVTWRNQVVAVISEDQRASL
jgi:ribosomal protein S28E/S33